jgi:ankyrin repeat protein
MNILQASIENNLNVVRSLLPQSKATINDFGDTILNMWSPLHYACSHANLEMVTLLLDNGANVDNQKKDGTPMQSWSPLHATCDPTRYVNQQDALLVVVKLLDAGADVDIQDTDGDTPLHVACNEGNEALVELLLRRGANPNLQESDGDTPLHVACEKGYEKVVELLLRNKRTICNLRSGALTPVQVVPGTTLYKIYGVYSKVKRNLPNSPEGYLCKYLPNQDYNRGKTAFRKIPRKKILESELAKLLTRLTVNNLRLARANEEKLRFY